MMILAMLANSLSWILDGDYEAIVNGHEIHAESHSEHHEAESAAVHEHDDDHHCSYGAHVMLGIVQNSSTILNVEMPYSQIDHQIDYHSQILPPPQRPPIS